MSVMNGSEKTAPEFEKTDPLSVGLSSEARAVQALSEQERSSLSESVNYSKIENDSRAQLAMMLSGTEGFNGDPIAFLTEKSKTPSELGEVLDSLSSKMPSILNSGDGEWSNYINGKINSVSSFGGSVLDSSMRISTDLKDETVDVFSGKKEVPDFLQTGATVGLSTMVVMMLANFTKQEKFKPGTMFMTSLMAGVLLSGPKAADMATWTASRLGKGISETFLSVPRSVTGLVTHGAGDAFDALHSFAKGNVEDGNSKLESIWGDLKSGGSREWNKISNGFIYGMDSDKAQANANELSQQRAFFEHNLEHFDSQKQFLDPVVQDFLKIVMRRKDNKEAPSPGSEDIKKLAKVYYESQNLIVAPNFYQIARDSKNGSKEMKSSVAITDQQSLILMLAGEQESFNSELERLRSEESPQHKTLKEYLKANPNVEFGKYTPKRLERDSKTGRVIGPMNELDMLLIAYLTASVFNFAITGIASGINLIKENKSETKEKPLFSKSILNTKERKKIKDSVNSGKADKVFEALVKYKILAPTRNSDIAKENLKRLFTKSPKEEGDPLYHFLQKITTSLESEGNQSQLTRADVRNAFLNELKNSSNEKHLTIEDQKRMYSLFVDQSKYSDKPKMLLSQLYGLGMISEEEKSELIPHLRGNYFSDKENSFGKYLRNFTEGGLPRGAVQKREVRRMFMAGMPEKHQSSVRITQKKRKDILDSLERGQSSLFIGHLKNAKITKTSIDISLDMDDCKHIREELTRTSVLGNPSTVSITDSGLLTTKRIINLAIVRGLRSSVLNQETINGISDSDRNLRIKELNTYIKAFSKTSTIYPTSPLGLDNYIETQEKAWSISDSLEQLSSSAESLAKGETKTFIIRTEDGRETTYEASRKGIIGRALNESKAGIKKTLGVVTFGGAPLLMATGRRIKSKISNRVSSTVEPMKFSLRVKKVRTNGSKTGVNSYVNLSLSYVDGRWRVRETQNSGIGISHGKSYGEISQITIK